MVDAVTNDVISVEQRNANTNVRSRCIATGYLVQRVIVSYAA